MLIEDAVSSGTPQFVIDSYATLAERAKTQSFGLIEEDVIVLDTETTGLSVQDNELIEISAARLSGREIVDRFDTFVHPKQLIPAEITELTSITNADVADAPSAVEAVAALADFVGGCPVIAHNATFDRSFIESVKGGVNVSDIWIDSLALSRIALPRLASHKLSFMADLFGCDSVSHRARGAHRLAPGPHGAPSRHASGCALVLSSYLLILGRAEPWFYLLSQRRSC